MVIPPFAPSFAWYVEWSRGISEGLSGSEAIAEANSILGVEGKDFARCLICGSNGPEMLSVPVIGGSHSLHRRDAERRALISGHGNWRHVHLGTLEAAYGRTPYYQHFMPGIMDILSCGYERLSELDCGMHIVLAGFLSMPHVQYSLPDAARERGKEIMESIDMEISVIDPLMRLGHDAILALLYKIYG